MVSRFMSVFVILFFFFEKFRLHMAYYALKINVDFSFRFFFCFVFILKIRLLYDFKILVCT